MLNGGQIHIGIGMELLCAWAATLMVTSQQGRLKQTNKQTSKLDALFAAHHCLLYLQKINSW